MKNINILFIISIMLFGLLVGCSEDVTPLVSVSHPEGWNVKGNENFHGTKVLTAGHFSCKDCHGTDYQGGQHVIGCHECHASYPHPAEWNLFANQNSHGAYVQKNEGSLDYCKKCHGMDLRGGQSGISCYSCHPEGSPLK